MPEAEDNVVAFKAAAKKKATAGKARIGIDALDATIVGGVLGTLLLAVGIVGGWVSGNTYTVAALACLVSAAVAAKIIKARRSA